MQSAVFVDRITLIRLSLGQTSDQVIVLQRTVTEFPDDPCPPRRSRIVPGPDNVFLAFRSAGILPIDPCDLVNDQIAAYYFHQDNDSIGINDPILGADFLSFNVNGTGTTARRGFGFDWVVVDGVLTIVFDNGDTNEFVAYSEDGDVAQILTIGALQSGLTRVLAEVAVGFDGVSEFSEDMLNDRRYRGLFAVFGDGELTLAFRSISSISCFCRRGGGCRQVGSTDPSFGIGTKRRSIWVSTPENYMDLYSVQSVRRRDLQQRRSWQAIDVVPGLLGDRYYVIENLDTEIGCRRSELCLSGSHGDTRQDQYL